MTDEKKLTPDKAYAYALRNGVVDPEYEAVIKRDPLTAVQYARTVLKGRFREAESVISTDPYASLLYAKDIMGDRFLQGETAISKHSIHSYFYAVEVIKGRFPEGEATISTEGRYAYYYSCLVLNKARFPEGEKTIIDSPYAKDYFKKVFLPNIHTVDKKNPSDVELKFLSMMI